jgi:uncharacterized protein YjbJ (UPF0337 family)
LFGTILAFLTGGGTRMNWDQIEGKWKQVKGSARQKWAKLTDDDLEFIAGNRDQFAGRLQERYGIAKEEAEKQVDEWQRTVSEPKASGSGGRR